MNSPLSALLNFEKLCKCHILSRFELFKNWCEMKEVSTFIQASICTSVNAYRVFISTDHTWYEMLLLKNTHCKTLPWTSLGNFGFAACLYCHLSVRISGKMSLLPYVGPELYKVWYNTSTAACPQINARWLQKGKQSTCMEHIFFLTSITNIKIPAICLKYYKE